VRYRHVDITSSYPAQQIKQQYPVGTPEVTVYDPEFAPCLTPRCMKSITRKKCSCPDSCRHVKTQPYTKKYALSDQPTAEQILEEEWVRSKD